MTLHREWANAVRQRGRAEPIELARRSRLEDLGIFGFAVLTAETMADGLSAATRYFPLVNGSGRWTLDRSRRLTRITWDPQARDGLGVRASVESVLAHFLVGAAELARGPLNATVWLSHPGGHDASFSALCQQPAIFGAPTNALEFSNVDLSPSNRLANAAMHEYFTEKCNEAIGATKPTLGERVARLLEDDFGNPAREGTPNATAVATALGMSRRTLHRKLLADNTSFLDVLERTRRRRARELIRTSSRSLTEVAFELGFSDSSSFSRAFRRWFATTPSAMRRATA